MKLRRWAVAQLVILVFAILLAACGAADDAARTLPGVIDDAGRALPGIIDDAGRTLPGLVDDAGRAAGAISDDVAALTNSTDNAAASLISQYGQVSQQQLTPQEENLVRQLLKEVVCNYFKDEDAAGIELDVQRLIAGSPLIDSQMKADLLVSEGRMLATSVTIGAGKAYCFAEGLRSLP